MPFKPVPNTHSKIVLSTTEQTVLFNIQLHAGEPLSLIAKRSNLKEHTVRYVVKKFLKEGFIKKRPLINLSALGYTDFIIYLSVSHASQKSKEDFEKTLKESDKIGDVLELGGEYRYGFVYCCKEPIEAADFVSKLAEHKDIRFFERVIGIRIASTLYRRKYFSKNPSQKIEKISSLRESKRVEIDDLDVKIISSLHQAYESHREIARTLEISHSTLESRLKKLTKNGVITGEVYGIQVQKFGILCYRLLIFLRRSSDDIRQRMIKFCDGNQSVVVCNEIFGSWNYELLTEVKDNHEIVDVVQNIYENFEDDVDAIKTLPLFQFLKVTDFPLKS